MRWGKGSETASSRNGKSNGFSGQQPPVFRGVDGAGEIPFGHPFRTSIPRIHPTFHLPTGARGNKVQPPGKKTGVHPVLRGTIGGCRSRTRLAGRRRGSTLEGATRKRPGDSFDGGGPWDGFLPYRQHQGFPGPLPPPHRSDVDTHSEGIPQPTTAVGMYLISFEAWC